MSDVHARIAVALERIAEALEGPKGKADPLRVDEEKTHKIAEEFKQRSGRGDF